MTVAEVIKHLETIKDKTRTVYLDCPHCGRSNEDCRGYQCRAHPQRAKVES